MCQMPHFRWPEAVGRGGRAVRICEVLSGDRTREPLINNSQPVVVVFVVPLRLTSTNCRGCRAVLAVDGRSYCIFQYCTGDISFHIYLQFAFSAHHTPYSTQHTPPRATNKRLDRVTCQRNAQAGGEHSYSIVFCSVLWGRKYVYNC